MLLDIASRTGIKLVETPFIGDSLKDLQAAERAGALPVLVRTGNGLETLAKPEMPNAAKVFDDLAAAVADILQE
jgi:D-glycero-D-manno-heptose 1,7-bisphosphate phosphatase